MQVREVAGEQDGIRLQEFLRRLTMGFGLVDAVVVTAGNSHRSAAGWRCHFQ